VKTRILLIEDDENITELVRYNIEREGYLFSAVADGEEGLMQAIEQQPDVILLDWMLPNISGLEICRQLRRKTETANVPIIMLTARADEPDRIRGLETGADDYMVKPFSPKELVVRIRAVLRRVRPALASDALFFEDIKLDNVSHRVTRAEVPIQLGPTEYRLLRHFMENTGRVFSREQLLDNVWGRDVYVEPRTVDVHIRRLRKALNAGNKPDLIRTVRSAGYSLDHSL
jgi:two-component system, OmpR family, phosphate regulon response regulator PhoB